jgi:two-component system nitrate/nitrite sensor histidine kinase NarX
VEKITCWSLISILLGMSLSPNYNLSGKILSVSATVIPYAIYGLSILLLAGWVAVLFVQRHKLIRERAELGARLQEARESIESLNQRLEVVFRVNQQFVEANDEEEIIDLVLGLSMDLTGAIGASFVPLDERGQPKATRRQGDFPFPVPDAWLEYLASPGIRQQCQDCKNYEHVMKVCPLLKGPFSDALGLYCLPLRRAGCEFGVLNLYMPDTARLVPEVQGFLRSLVDATALALEGMRLRSREMAILGELQAIRKKADLQASQSDLLKKAAEALEADYVLLVARPELAAGMEYTLKLRGGTQYGEEIPDAWLQQLENAAQTVFSDGHEITLDQVTDPGLPGKQTWAIVPLLIPDHPPIGVMVVGRRRQPEAFQPRQLALLRTVADEAVLVVQAARQLTNLEFRTMMAERVRLAREIHDGLAQTLGFLKLQMAQMQGYLERSELQRLQQMLKVSYETLADAYQDAREAIDGLRVSVAGENGFVWPQLGEWLQQVVAEFQDNVELQSLRINLVGIDSKISLSPEVHAQLIRIVQEALSNVRKHAQAEQVWVSCWEADGDLILEVRDDGKGFSAGDMPGSARYGLRGMRERAELIGADFQVISRPDQGTTIHVRLPLSEQHRMEM